MALLSNLETKAITLHDIITTNQQAVTALAQAFINSATESRIEELLGDSDQLTPVSRESVAPEFSQVREAALDFWKSVSEDFVRAVTQEIQQAEFNNIVRGIYFNKQGELLDLAIELEFQD